MSAEQRELGRLARNGNISALPEDQRTVVILRLGWDGGGPRSQQAVANQMGFSQPHISTLERHAKTTLEQQIPILDKAFRPRRRRKVPVAV